MTMLRLTLLATASLATGGLGKAAQAQSADERAENPPIVVTAQRREQELGEVGISITAFQSDDVEGLGWRDSEDIAAQVPGLVARSFSGSGSIGLFSLRGVAQNDFNDHQEAPVAIYVDQAYRPFTGSATAALFDVERIEVLRGPQGTLFGRNATGGLINVVNRKPSQELEGYLAGGMGTYGSWRAEGAVSVPLSDTLSTRLSVRALGSDGYFRVPDRPRANPADLVFGDFPVISDADSAGNLRNLANRDLRFQLAFEPNDGLSFAYRLEIGEVDHVRNGYDTLAAPTGVIDPDGTDFYGTPIDPRPWREDPDLLGFVDKRYSNHTFDAEVDFGSWQVNAQAAFGALDKTYLEDDDGGPFAIGLFGTDQDGEHHNLELRASGQFPGGNWQVGANHLRIEGDYFAIFQFPAITGASGPGVFDGFGLGYDTSYSLETRATAVFGQLELDLTDTVRLIGGLRWTGEEQDFAISVRCVDDPAVPPGTCAAFGVEPGSVASLPAPAMLEQDNDLFSGRLQLEYAPDDEHLFWLGYNRGVKGGGYAIPLDGIQVASRLPYDPETLHAFEAGARLTSGDLTASASAFAYVYEDYQGFVIEGLTTVIGNFPARIYGGEAELRYRDAAGWDIAAGLSLLHARVHDVEVSPGTFATQHMTLAPSTSANLAISRTVNLGPRHQLVLGVDGNYSSSIYFNTLNGPLVQADDYAMANARAAVRLPVGASDGEIAVQVTNLFNSRAVDYSFDLSLFFGNVLRTYAPPRQAEVSLRLAF